MHDDPKPGFHQFSIVAQFIYPFSVVAGHFGRLWIFEPDHIAGLCGADSGHLHVLSSRRVQQGGSDVGVSCGGGEVSAEGVLIAVLVVSGVNVGVLGANSDAVLVFFRSLMVHRRSRVASAGCHLGLESTTLNVDVYPLRISLR